MPFCPTCRSEYREGFRRCADCNVDLVAELTTLPSPTASAGPWSQIFEGDPKTAELIRSVLETSGVKTVAPDDMIPQIHLYAPTTGGQVRLFVATADLPKVKEILSEDPHAHLSGNEEQVVRFPCPCGQMLETPSEAAGTEMECPYCGQTLTVPGT